nr:pre-mrna-splicing factor ATP-dependent RNA helicase deah7 [Ipomoea batatas]
MIIAEEKGGEVDFKEEARLSQHLNKSAKSKTTTIISHQRLRYSRRLNKESAMHYILATNIAETSSTVDGILYVIDTGYGHLVHSYKSSLEGFVQGLVFRASDREVMDKLKALPKIGMLELVAARESFQSTLVNDSSLLER